MSWFLLLVGLLLVILGVWGGPLRRKRPDKASRIPKEATVQEAWDILTSPVQYDDELIKIPEHRPWYIPGRDRRFQQGLLVGLGGGLLVAAVLLPFLPGKEAPAPQVAQPPGGAMAKPGNEQKPGGQGAPAQSGGQAQPPEGGAGGGQGQAGGQPAATPANVTFAVEPGSSSQEIAANLKAAGLIATEKEFLDKVAELGVETRLKAGTFVIPTNAKVEVIIAELTK